MAKDPAFLFYPADWLGGTMTMTRQAKGAYIDLLIAQFNSGHLSETQIKTLLGQDQGLWGTVLREKFLVDADGRYYNCRLDEEIEKRKNFSKKQSEKVKKRWDEYHGIYNGNTMVLPNNVNENRDVNENEKEGVGEKTKKFGKREFREKLLSLGVQEKFVEAWLEVRVKKRASFSEVALDAIVEECRKHEYPIEDAVKICAEMGWQGFKFSWIKNQNNGGYEKQHGSSSAARIAAAKAF